MLVTGGAGYIGSHAAKALARAGHRVVVYDNLVAGHREAVKYGEFVQGDVLDAGALRSTIEKHGVKAVMHFAAFLDVGESVREPARYYRNNVTGALSVLEAMAIVERIRAGSLRYVLPVAFGETIIADDVGEEEVREALQQSGMPLPDRSSRLS